MIGTQVIVGEGAFHLNRGRRNLKGVNLLCVRRTPFPISKAFCRQAVFERVTTMTNIYCMRRNCREPMKGLRRNFVDTIRRVSV